MRKMIVLVLTFLLLVNIQVFAQKEKPILRFPDIHEDLVVFTHQNDIWKCDVSGGEAIRLTLNDGDETYPKFSNDGKYIAFTGEFDGNSDIYVMDIYGGNIRRLTYHPGYDVMVGWHPTENKIIFRSDRKSYSRFSRLFMVSPDDLEIEELILPEVVQGSFSPDGSKIAFNKVAREHRNWKRYTGGLAQDIYLYDYTTKKEVQLTSFEGTDRIPMWIGDKIYFSSDKTENRRLNLFSINPVTKERKQLTFHEKFDVGMPSEGGKKIVYELGGSIHLYDIEKAKTQKLNIQILSDAPETRPALVKVTDRIQDFNISPCGNRALVVARGEIFSVPKAKGATRNISQNCGARDKDAVWSPDGSRIAYFSDKDGEYQLYLYNCKTNETEKLTNFQSGYRHSLHWSPDGEKLAFTDQTLSLFIIDVDNKKITKVDKAEYEHVDIGLDEKPIYDFAWSPDSELLAYSKKDMELVTRVYLYSLKKEKVWQVSGDLFNDFHPAFSADGNYLFFASNRRFKPTYCDFEWEMVYKNSTGLYYVSLKEDAPSLLPLQSDEVCTDNEKEEKITGDLNVKPFNIQALPVERGNYRFLTANESKLFYLNKDEEGDFNRFEFRGTGAMDLYAFDLASREEEKLLEAIDEYRLSADGSTILYKKGKDLGIIATDNTGDDNSLDLSGLEMKIDPKKEWRQIFWEAWRMERDFYYEAGMHGQDWPAVGEKYAELLEYASCRTDVGHLIGEMIAELNTSHTYVYGGDSRRKGQHVNVGLLGADYKIDPKNKRYQFEKIFRVPDWTREVYPPLAGPGIDVKAGMYLLQVNGKDVHADKNIYSYFENLAGKNVTLLINDSPKMRGAKKITVKPLHSESTLRYRAWLEHNRRVVAEATDGKVGYIHMPDTYNGTATEFPKYFYSQSQKEGLVIDGRFNGGGLDPAMFLQRLRKKPHIYWTRRYSHDQMSPYRAVRAHMALITNRQAGSGGDELPYEFQHFKMGPVIGTRTWGGLVGVSMFIELMDGGGLTAPDYRIYSPEGDWVVENEGVTPDIEIDLNPNEMARGYDSQLMKAVEVIMEQIKKNPRTWPEHPEYPDN
ncbi:MAG: S41 family peptidase [Fidelibacterota bacterium]